MSEQGQSCIACGAASDYCIVPTPNGDMDCRELVRRARDAERNLIAALADHKADGAEGAGTHAAFQNFARALRANEHREAKP